MDSIRLFFCIVNLSLDWSNGYIRSERSGKNNSERCSGFVGVDHENNHPANECYWFISRVSRTWLFSGIGLNFILVHVVRAGLILPKVWPLFLRMIGTSCFSHGISGYRKEQDVVHSTSFIEDWRNKHSIWSSHGRFVIKSGTRVKSKYSYKSFAIFTTEESASTSTTRGSYPMTHGRH